ncbi:MAG: hypothetical protein JNL08_13375 [Planctomycetes bacterium]|nr:hypothetical protein [Planctomycetota bacterium]
MVLTTCALAAQTPPPAPPPVQEPKPAPTPAPQPTPTPTPTPEAQQQPPAPPPAPEPIDPTRAAAEALRRRLGLKPGPAGDPPAGPPTTPPVPPPPTTTTQPDAAAPQSQDPPPNPAPPPTDPTDAAKRALQRVLPTAEPPAVAPIPDATGVPEAAAPAPPAAAAAPVPVAVPWAATLASRYRARHGDGFTDQDLVARLSLDVGRSSTDAVTLHLAARGYADLDGRRDDDPFAGLDQSLGDDFDARLYRAHLDAHRLPHVALLRLGRQDHDETPTPITFDGLRLDSAPLGAVRAWLSAYGGVPVHHFEASARGDSVVGFGAGLQPWQQARVRLDWMDLRDEFLAADRRDGLFGARWWQTLGPMQLRGLHTWRDGRARDLQVVAAGQVAEPLHVTVDYRELLTTQRTQVTELDPFTDIALDYVPYRQLGATLGLDLDEHVALGAGADVRRLSDRSDEREFNREFERYHADVTLRDFAVPGLSLVVSGSLWQTSGEAFRTLAGELEYRPDRALRAALGTAYDLYRYDAFDDRERVHVRSWYLRLDRRVGAALRVDGAYEYERDDDAEFHLFRLGVTWTL